MAELQRQKEMLELQETIEMFKAKTNVMSEFQKVNLEPLPQRDADLSESKVPILDKPLKTSDPEHQTSDAGLHTQQSQIPTCEATSTRRSDPLQDYAGLLRLPVVEVKKFGEEVTEFA